METMYNMYGACEILTAYSSKRGSTPKAGLIALVCLLLTLTIYTVIAASSYVEHSVGKNQDVSYIDTEQTTLTATPVDATPVDGLVAHWKLDDQTSGRALDEQGRFNGTFYSFSNVSESSINGKVGGALLFDGSDDGIVILNSGASSLNFPTTSFTYSVWLYPQYRYSHQCPIWKGTDSGSPGYALCMVYGSGSKFAFAQISNGTASKSTSFGTKVLVDTWTLLTVVVDRQNNVMKTYVDGAYTGQSTDISNIGSISSGHNFQIGKGHNWLPYRGAIDDIRAYNRTLTDQEIASLYDVGKQKKSLTLFFDASSTGSGNITSTHINCGNGADSADSCFYTAGTAEQVTLQAVPNGTSYIDSWVLSNKTAICASSPTCTVSMENDETITVKFRDATQEEKFIVANSCQIADVQAAVNSASNGNTVIIPPGNCTWGEGGTSLSISKYITVQGFGPERTIIHVSNQSSMWGSIYNQALFRVSAPATIKGMSIYAAPSGDVATIFNFGANGFRLSDIHSYGSTARTGYFVYSSAYGLIDSSYIQGGKGNDELIFVRGPTDSWQTPSSMGGADNLFIEDTVVAGSGYVTDCNSNSRCVVRFSNVTGGIKIDGHGKASNSPPRGVRHMEVYGNKWNASIGVWAAIELRGGTGRVFNNSAGPAGLLILHEYGATAAWPSFGSVLQTVENYPIDDQIGVGKDPKSAASEPMYLWSNYKQSSPWAVSLGWGNYDKLFQIIVPDRDYYIHNLSFDGSSGVGVGTLAQMYAITPTKNNVGFWATDVGNWNTLDEQTDGQLYIWNSTAWNLDYEPYPYPHPLRIADADKQAPVITILSPTLEQAQNQVTINVTLDEVGLCQYSIDNGTTNISLTANQNYTQFTKSVSELSDQLEVLRIYCKDLYENVNESSPLNIQSTYVAPVETVTEVSTSRRSGGGGTGGGSTMVLSALNTSPSANVYSNTSATNDSQITTAHDASSTSDSAMSTTTSGGLELDQQKSDAPIGTQNVQTNPSLDVPKSVQIQKMPLISWQTMASIFIAILFFSTALVFAANRTTILATGSNFFQHSQHSAQPVVQQQRMQTQTASVGQMAEQRTNSVLTNRATQSSPQSTPGLHAYSNVYVHERALKHNLEEYVARYLKAGYTPNQLIDACVHKGWDKSYMQRLMRDVMSKVK